jgi:amidophosphoribosyltransferase
MLDKFHEECAIVGLINSPDAAKYCYLGLYSLQHRGQEGAGIVSTDGGRMFCHRDMGLVADVFDAESLARLQGSAAVGHTRYATCGSSDLQNLQPLVANFQDNSFAIAHNGNLINATEIRRSLENEGAIFSTTSDTETILHLVARAPHDSAMVDRVAEALKVVRGAYSLIVLTFDSLLAVRDPAGVRPLSLGKIEGGYVVASESCAFDLIGATFVRDIEPGEILEIRANGEMFSNRSLVTGKHAFCVFEYVYFSRPDSLIEGKNVYGVRKQLGAELAREHPAEADLVIPVPDSGVPSAIGYAQVAGLPMEFGLIRNHYVGRTFIEPEQSIRDFGVKIKLNPNKELLQGKRIVVVDDSIVRGTTSKKIVKMLRQAGASEVHFRISSPPTIGPCHYGIDTPSTNELIASTHKADDIRKYIEADTLGYLSIEGMYRAVGRARDGFCDACFSGLYPLVTPAEQINPENVFHNQKHRKINGSATATS